MHETKTLQDEPFTSEYRNTDQVLSDVAYFIEALNVSFRQLSILFSRIMQKYNKLFLYEITGKLSEQFFESFKIFIEHVVSVKDAFLTSQLWRQTETQNASHHVADTSSDEENDINSLKIVTSYENTEISKKLNDERFSDKRLDDVDTSAVRKKPKTSRATPPLLMRGWDVSVDIETDEEIKNLDQNTRDFHSAHNSTNNEDTDQDLMTFSPTLSTRLLIAPNVAPLSLSKVKAKLQEEKLKSSKSASSMKCTDHDPVLYASAVKEYEETVRSKSPFGDNTSHGKQNILLNESVTQPSHNNAGARKISGYSNALLKTLQQYEALKKEEKLAQEVIKSLGFTLYGNESKIPNFLSLLQDTLVNNEVLSIEGDLDNAVIDEESICALIVKAAILENRKRNTTSNISSINPDVETKQDERLLEIENGGPNNREEDMTTPTPPQSQYEDLLHFSVTDTASSQDIPTTTSTTPISLLSGISHSSSSSELSVASEYSLISELSATSEEVRQINHRFFKAISREIRMDQPIHPVKTVKNILVHPGLPAIPTPDYTRQNTFTNIECYFDELQPFTKRKVSNTKNSKNDTADSNTVKTSVTIDRSKSHLSDSKRNNNVSNIKENLLKLAPEIKIRKPSNNVLPEKVADDDSRYLSPWMQRRKVSEEICTEVQNSVCSPPINRSIKPSSKNDNIELPCTHPVKSKENSTKNSFRTDLKLQTSFQKHNENSAKTFFPEPDYSPNSTPVLEKKNMTLIEDIKSPRKSDLLLEESRVTLPPVKLNASTTAPIIDNKLSDLLVGRTSAGKDYPPLNFEDKLYNDELLNWYRGYDGTHSKIESVDMPPPLPARSRKLGNSKIDLYKSERYISAS